MAKHFTVENPFLRRKWGWAFCTSPNGFPEHPQHTGTLKQVREAIRNDKTYQSLGTASYTTAWFYDGQRVLSVDGVFMTDWLADIDTERGINALDQWPWHYPQQIVLEVE